MWDKTKECGIISGENKKNTTNPKIMATFSHYFMSKILGLQGVIIYQADCDKDGYQIKIGQPRKPSLCPFCESKKIHNHGRGRKRTIKHARALDGKNIYLHWQSRRYLCNKCGKSWSQSPPEILVRGKEQYSVSHTDQAMRDLRNNSFNYTAENNGMSYPVLSKKLKEVVPESPEIVQKIWPQEGTVSLGIDEHGRVKKRLALTITMLRPKREVLRISPGATAKELRKWVLNNLTEEQMLQVGEICMDMKKSLRRCLKQLFPNARFVVDKFHIIQYLNHLITLEYQSCYRRAPLRLKDKLPGRGKELHITKILQQSGMKWSEKEKEKVKTVFLHFPEVAKLWYVKEEVRAVYRECHQRNRKEAKERLKYIFTWLPEVPKRTLNYFLEEVLNYFDNHTTNAYVEGKHTKCKLIKRQSFGIKNEEIYVKKLMLGLCEPKYLNFPHTF